MTSLASAGELALDGGSSIALDDDTLNGLDSSKNIVVSVTADGYTGDETCSVCQYVAKQGEVIPSQGIEETTDEIIEDTQPEKKDGTLAGTIAIIIAAIIVIGGAIILILKNRKK